MNNINIIIICDLFASCLSTSDLSFSDYFYVREKGKFCSRTGHNDAEGEKGCSSILSLTSALDVVESLTLYLSRFTPGKEICYSFYGRLDGPQGRSGRVQKISLPNGIRHWERYVEGSCVVI
jgi:hypothetical protein